jgi:nucleoside-diphosphate-sugar epimerase
MFRAIVTGVTGHLGLEIARQLGTAGIEVHGLTRRHQPPGMRDIPCPLHWVDGELTSLMETFGAVRPDVLIHLVSCYRREHKEADLGPMIEANILLGVQLLEAATRAGCSRVITAGTYFQHYDADHYRALNLYAATKQAFEDILSFYVDAFEISAAVLNLYDVYSERDTRPKLMSALSRALEAGTAVHLPADDFAIDLVHVEDAAAAFVHAASTENRKILRRGVLSRFSICSGIDTTLSELVTVFERVGRSPISVVRGGYMQPSRVIKRPWRGTILPGWTPHVTLEEGVARMITKAMAGHDHATS